MRPYVAGPVIKQLVGYLGRPQADVRVITSPRLKGIQSLMAQICEILKKYGPVSDMVIFVVDGDCEDGRDGKIDGPTNSVD